MALLTLVYGALAALAQRDLKRLVAYTSVNHMGYVLLAVGAWALLEDPGARQLALNGAVVQMVSHGLLTGGLFFLVGMLQDRAHTRDMGRFSGLQAQVPVYSWMLALFAFGSLGLPGLSGFIAEFQVLGGTIGVGVWAAAVAVLGLIVITGLFVRMVVDVVMGSPAAPVTLADLRPRELTALVPLAGFSLLIGLLPVTLVAVVDAATAALAAL